MSEEKWRAIDGYEALYEVSNFGRVRSISFTNNRYINKPWNHIMKPFDNGHGYLMISLTKDGKRKNFYIHRLVASAFLDKPSGMTEVNHIDHNRKNNRTDNLEWCIRKDNVRYSADLMKHQKKFSRSTSTGEKYIQIKNHRYRVAIKHLGIDKRFETLKEAIAFRDEVMR